MQHPHPYPPHGSDPVAGSIATGVVSGFSDSKSGKKRGSYSCGRCGLPKKGHVCHVKTTSNATTATPTTTCATNIIATTPTDSSIPAITSNTSVPSSFSAVRRPTYELPMVERNPSNLRRALLFDDVDERTVSGGSDWTDPVEDGDDVGVSLNALNPVLAGGLRAICLWEVLKRLPPACLLSAARVCKGWRETARRLWKAAEELRLKVPVKAQVGFVGSMLQKCSGLVRLSLSVECDVDATMLACIAFSCPNLKSVEISTSEVAVNRINGDELGRFIADKRFLKSFKMEGCSNLGGFVLGSSSLSILWLSDLYSLAKMVFNCPQLREVSLEFSCQGNDSTDLTTLVDGLGRSCPKLQNIHIASIWLSHSAVLALTDAQFRCLRMLSLVLGSGITDASVAAISSSYPHLELLDLSGSSISDSGIGMICNVFPGTLTRLLLALCPNVTSSGIQFATAQLPLLELMDCGMTTCDLHSQDPKSCEDRDCDTNKTSSPDLHVTNQKLIIKHDRLKKLSLWGCTGLDGLYLNCPKLHDLNLNACKNLHPERLLLHCPGLETVHASGCRNMLIGAIRSQVRNKFLGMEDLSPRKLLPDGSKRVQAPHLVGIESSEVNRKRKATERSPCNVIVK